MFPIKQRRLGTPLFSIVPLLDVWIRLFCTKI